MRLVLKIIILDDSRIIRRIIEVHLDELDVHQDEVECFDDSNEALIYIKENDADIVFCDEAMPNISDDGFIKQLFQFRPDLQKSFFLISSNDDKNTLQEFKDLGIQRFLKKPIDEKNFNHFIKKEIEQIRLKAKNSLITLKHQKEMIDKHIIISQTDLYGRITYVSKAFSQISGYSKSELIGCPHSIVRHPEMPSETFEDVWKTIKSGKEWSGEIKNLRKDGTFYWVHSTINPIYDENKNKIGYTSVRVDITDKKKIEELTRIDYLTGAYNRRAFNDLFDQSLKSAIRVKKVFCFILLDIDYFKKYNDFYGHPNGDIVLKAVTQCLMKNLNRSTDFCFRLGGEEFGIIFQADSHKEAVAYTEQMRSAIEALKIEHQKSNASEYVTASFGMVCIDELKENTSQSLIYNQADNLLYDSKNSGRNRIKMKIL